VRYLTHRYDAVGFIHLFTTIKVTYFFTEIGKIDKQLPISTILTIQINASKYLNKINSTFSEQTKISVFLICSLSQRANLILSDYLMIHQSDQRQPFAIVKLTETLKKCNLH